MEDVPAKKPTKKSSFNRYKNEEEKKEVPTSSNTSTIEAPGSKVLLPAQPSYEPIKDEVEVRLEDFKEMSSDSSDLLPDAPEEVEFQWDDEVEEEYKRNIRNMMRPHYKKDDVKLRDIKRKKPKRKNSFEKKLSNFLNPRRRERKEAPINGNYNIQVFNNSPFLYHEDDKPEINVVTSMEPSSSFVKKHTLMYQANAHEKRFPPRPPPKKRSTLKVELGKQDFLGATLPKPKKTKILETTSEVSEISSVYKPSKANSVAVNKPRKHESSTDQKCKVFIRCS